MLAKAYPVFVNFINYSHINRDINFKTYDIPIPVSVPFRFLFCTIHLV